MKIFHLPDLGEGLAEAEIREWYVKVGDIVKVDQPIVSMETAKAVVDVPSPYAGKIEELHGKANDIIKTGAPLVTFLLENAAAEKAKGSVVGHLEESMKKWEEGDVLIGSPKRVSTIKTLPAARTLAKQLNVDLQLVKGSGPQGMITLDDVQKFSESHRTELPEGAETLHGVRRTMAQVTAHAHREVVPVSIIEDADITNLPPDIDMTVRLLQALVFAVKAEPALNVWFDGHGLQRKLFDEVNIGLAVDTKEGLFVPVIKEVEKKSPEELRKMIDHYKEAVKTRSVSPADLQGATITLSNFGTIAGRYANPLIVPPTVAILGVGRARFEAVPRGEEITIRRILPLSLTFDHRAATGGEATRFLAALIKNLEEK